MTFSILRLMGIHGATETPVTEEEMRILLDQATEGGTFQAAERDMLNGVIRLGNRTVADVMTPKKDVDWLDVDAPPEVVRQTMRESRHQRFPVARGDLDNVLGMVQSKDLLLRLLKGQPLDLKACIKQPLYVPEGTPALRVLEMLKAHPIHAAVVVDEYGALQGVVSLNDILVSLTPGTLNALSELEGTVVRREDGSWLLDGVLPVDETKEALGIHTLEGEERGYFHTLAGFVMLRLGRIPHAGDHFHWGGFRFEVVDMDGLRIDKVLVAVEAEKSDDEGG